MDVSHSNQMYVSGRIIGAKSTSGPSGWSSGYGRNPTFDLRTARSVEKRIPSSSKKVHRRPSANTHRQLYECHVGDFWSFNLDLLEQSTPYSSFVQSERVDLYKLV